MQFLYNHVIFQIYAVISSSRLVETVGASTVFYSKRIFAKSSQTIERSEQFRCHLNCSLLLAPRVGPSQIFLENLLSDNAVNDLLPLCKLPSAT